MLRLRTLVAPALALVVLAALVAPFASMGCATSPGTGETHGPVFTFDGNVPSSSEAGDDASGPDDATMPSVGNDSSVFFDQSQGDDTGQADDGGILDAASEDANDAFAPVPDCGSPTVVLAGSSSSLVGAIAVGTGAFTTNAITGSATFAPALVASTGGFEALVAMDGDAGGGGALFGFDFAGTTWSSPVALGGSAGASDAPAIAAMGSTVQGVYLNPQHLYFHAQFNGTSWDTGADKVLTSNGTVQSFGPVRASAAASATELVIVYEGNDGHLYAQSWTTAGGWQSGIEVGTLTLGTNIAPAIVALTGSSTSDFLVVYAVASTATPPLNYLNYALRSSATKTWSSPALTNATAYTPYEPTLAAMSGGRAIVGWRGGNNLPYTMELDPAPATVDGGPGGTWTVPTPIASVNITTAPSLATGTCGYDAVAALATNGTVTVGQYTGGAWVPPTPIAGVTGVTFAAIATSQ